MREDETANANDGQETPAQPGLSRRRFLILGAAAGGAVAWGVGVAGTGIAGATGSPTSMLLTLRSQIAGTRGLGDLRNQLLALVGDALDAARQNNMVGACADLARLLALLEQKAERIGEFNFNRWRNEVEQLQIALGCCVGPTGGTGADGTAAPNGQGCSGPPKA